MVHPQIVLPLAVYQDSSLKAPVGTPDMRLPIQYAITHPRRRPSPAAPPTCIAAGRLDFQAPDETRAPASAWPQGAGALGSAHPGRDEVASGFLGGTLDFPGVPRLSGKPWHAMGRAQDQARGRAARGPRSRGPDAFAAPGTGRGTAPVRQRRGGMAIIHVVAIALFVFILEDSHHHPRGRPLRADQAFRIRVQEFGIGSRRAGPAAKGGTLYTLNWLPIEGFVRLEGKNSNSDDRARSPCSGCGGWSCLSRPGHEHYLLAFVIFFEIAWLATPQDGLSLAEVQAGSPAAAAGLVAGEHDRGHRRPDVRPLPGPDAGRAAIKLRRRQARKMTLTVKIHKDGSLREVPVTLRR